MPEKPSATPAEVDQETTRLLVYAQAPNEEPLERTMPLVSRLDAAHEPPPPPAFYVDPEMTTFSYPPIHGESVVPAPPPLLIAPPAPLGPRPAAARSVTVMLVALAALALVAAGICALLLAK